MTCVKLCVFIFPRVLWFKFTRTFFYRATVQMLPQSIALCASWNHLNIAKQVSHCCLWIKGIFWRVWGTGFTNEWDVPNELCRIQMSRSWWFSIWKCLEFVGFRNFPNVSCVQFLCFTNLFAFVMYRFHFNSPNTKLC